MKRYSTAVAFCLASLIAGCTESTAPAPSRIHVVALTPLRSTGVQGGTVTTLPAVRVTDLEGSPVAGKQFTFTIESPLGQNIVIHVRADNDGIARLPSWTLGHALGRYAATVATEDWWKISFEVYVPGDAVAIYDMKTINGAPVSTFPGSESHFVLYESGFMNWFFRMPDREFTPEQQHLGTYRQASPQQFDFELECGTTFLQRCARWGLTAAIRGNELVIDKSDPGDIGDWIETYTLRHPLGK